MNKVIAVLNVIAWGGFWAFGYLALTADVDQSGQMVTALFLAALGAGVGVFAFVWLARHAERSGYAPKTNKLNARAREIAQAQHGAEG